MWELGSWLPSSLLPLVRPKGTFSAHPSGTKAANSNDDKVWKVA